MKLLGDSHQSSDTEAKSRRNRLDLLGNKSGEKNTGPYFGVLNFDIRTGLFQAFPDFLIFDQDAR